MNTNHRSASRLAAGTIAAGLLLLGAEMASARGDLHQRPPMYRTPSISTGWIPVPDPDPQDGITESRGDKYTANMRAFNARHYPWLVCENRPIIPHPPCAV